MPMLYYEMQDGSDGQVLLDEAEDALDFIVQTEKHGPDFYIKSAWLDDVPYIGECTRNVEWEVMQQTGD